ncbi:uncharacterized protein Tco025E_08404 [Trypanosoma conorhini]|uniref:Uncharacterized protein n=1 Tax=Trypanosoma conorhini TaxID=83891 RepID=A0A3R7NGM6_9TRYP|nr:uncharacterized protein Tco025E_08404 [Trypanosoma conorhini]RNF02405.1 hypothetical protein Tco025E_08404 [Trypanosoma conorhini]
MLFSPAKMCIVLLLLVLCGPATGAAAQVDVHVVNLTVVAVGWPRTVEELSHYTKTVTSVVCGPLASAAAAANRTPIPCGGLLAPVGEEQLSVQVSASTASPGNAFLVRRTFWDWAQTSAPAMLEALTNAVSAVAPTPLSTLSKVAGVYTVPCRSNAGSAVLPLCETTNNCLTSIIVDGLEEDVSSVFCGYVPSPCGSYIAAKMLSSDQVLVNITNLPNTLEVALLFMDQVRSSVLHASRIQLYSDGQLALIYATDENELYDKGIKVLPQCGVETALWMLSFIALIPILFLLFCYLWCMGRHHAKKLERKAIVEDELRAQGMSDAQGAAGSAPGAQRFATYASDYPQEMSASQVRPEQQQTDAYGGYNQFVAGENFAYPQEVADDAQREGDAVNDVYAQQAYNEVEEAAFGDEYVEPSLAATYQDGGMRVEESQSHAPTRFSSEEESRPVEKAGYEGSGRGTASLRGRTSAQVAPAHRQAPFSVLLYCRRWSWEQRLAGQRTASPVELPAHRCCLSGCGRRLPLFPPPLTSLLLNLLVSRQTHSRE